MPKFSVITPTWNRWDNGYLGRAIVSVMSQEYGDFEHIIVDDGSLDSTNEAIATLMQDNARLRYVKQEHSGRVIARNEGMKAAKGDWIVWLDSDDALDIMYLKTFDHFTRVYPSASLLVGGVVFHGMVKEEGKHVCPAWTKLRLAQKPPLSDDPHFPIHDHFPSGTTGTGMFVFKQECLEVTGVMPYWNNHDEVADGVDDWLGYETGYGSDKKHVGNPWGDDWAMYRKLTMYYEAFILDSALYIQYVR